MVVGWCDGAGLASSTGMSYFLDNSRSRVYCACSRHEVVGGGGWWTFFSRLSFLSSFSLSLGDSPLETEILSQTAVKPKTTNQSIKSFKTMLAKKTRRRRGRETWLGCRKSPESREFEPGTGHPRTEELSLSTQQ